MASKRRQRDQSDNYGIQADSVQADALAVGPGARAVSNRGVGGRSDAGAELDTDAASPPPTVGPQRRVFVSYSHQDRVWLDRLRTHLAPLLRKGALQVWEDSQLQPGSRWRDEIRQAIAAAGAAVLLVSPAFLASEFIASHELPRLLAAARKRGCRLFWVPVAASLFEETELGEIQAAHDPQRPLETLSEAERNAALVAICRRIRDGLGG